MTESLTTRWQEADEAVEALVATLVAEAVRTADPTSRKRPRGVKRRTKNTRRHIAEIIRAQHLAPGLRVDRHMVAALLLGHRDLISNPVLVVAVAEACGIITGRKLTPKKAGRLRDASLHVADLIALAETEPLAEPAAVPTADHAVVPTADHAVGPTADHAVVPAAELAVAYALEHAGEPAAEPRTGAGAAAGVRPVPETVPESVPVAVPESVPVPEPVPESVPVPTAARLAPRPATVPAQPVPQAPRRSLARYWWPAVAALVLLVLLILAVLAVV